MNTRLLLAAASAAAATVLNAHAVLLYGDYPLEAEVGSGANTSICVFDFGAATPNQYAFGYAYDSSDPAKTGSDMLQALIAANIPGLTIDLVVDPVYGDYVNGISYASYSLVTLAGDPYLYPNYWIGDGGVTGPTSWTSADFGISARKLTDGSWDGWTQASYFSDGNTEALAPSGIFAAVVPEPTALSLLALGAGLMATRARPRRKARGQRR